MASGGKGLDKLEVAVHTIIVLIGIIILGAAKAVNPDEPFLAPLLMNVGASLVVVTVLFAIFESFRREYVDTTPDARWHDQYERGTGQEAQEARELLLRIQTQVQQDALPRNLANSNSPDSSTSDGVP